MVRETSVGSFYTHLKDAAYAAISYPVQIFPSTADTDSLCALKIVTSILANDSLRFSCYPVSSYNDIFGLAGAKLSSEEDPLVVLLINWGCSRDLRRFLKLGPKVLVFVVDSHRPIHLHNLNDNNKNVVVLYTREDENQADLAYDFDVSALANACDLDGDDDVKLLFKDSDSDSSDGEANEEENRTKRRRLNENNEYDNQVNAELKACNKLRARYYRMGTFYGSPSGLVMFDIAYVFHKNTSELLWLAIVSLTDQFVHERITSERYQAGVMELEQQVNSAGHLEMVTSVILKDGTKVRTPDFCRISYEDEPRLMLLREWNLYDSMLCSSYPATKLKTWSDSGVKRMKLLLAQTGIPLVECRQQFRYMSNDSKRRFNEELQKFLADYGLTEFYYRSFQRRHGYTSNVSAADTVYGVTALMEGYEESWADQFWRAFIALSLDFLDELHIGMQLAIKVQRSIFRQVNLAMTRRGFIKSTKSFRWIKLEDQVDIRLLSYPQALTRLCYFIMDALREKGARMKPLIIASPVPITSMALVVGITNRPCLGIQHGNQFGQAFRAVAEEICEDRSHEAFDSSWIRLEVKFLNAFMQRITEIFQ